MSVNAEGTGNAQMGVLGQGQQWNVFGGADNHDVTVVIAHEHNEIAVRIGTDKRLSVEIINHGLRPRRLSLRVDGFPREVAIIHTTTAALAPGEATRTTVTLRCDSMTPEAGERPLRVVATDLDSDGLSWRSDAKRILIPPRPDVRLALVGPENVVAAGRYHAQVDLRNLGNTRVAGSVRFFDQTDKNIRSPEMSFPGGHHNGHVTRFETAPGESAPLSLELMFPTQGWRRRRWEMSFQLSVERDDTSDTDHRFWVEQQGRLADLANAVTNTFDAARGGDPRSVTLRRGALLSGLAVAFVVAAVFGLVAILSPRPQVGTGQPAGSTAVEIPLEEAPPASAAPPDIYSAMPCVQGGWVIFLGAIAGEDSDTDAQFVFEHETARLGSIAPDSPYTVHASTMDGVCAKALDYVGTDSPDRRFIWLAPLVSSKAEAKQVCVDLGKPLTYDCLPWPTT
jgi:hypothetical protein